MQHDQKQMDIASKVKKGGKVLAIRQILYMGLSFANIMVIARILGPVNYGIASITLNYFFFILWFSGMGLGDYMIKKESLEDDVIKTLSAFHIVFGALLVAVLMLIAPLLAWASEQPEITPLLRCVAFALFFELLAGFSFSLMRRDLEFAYIGGIEMLCQVLIYVTSLTLVFLGASYWAPILGILAGSVAKLVLVYRKAPFPISLRMQMRHLRPALKFGVALSGASALSNLRMLLVPLGVTPILGIEAAGIVNLTIRLTQQLSLLRQNTRFMSLGVLSKFSADKERLGRVASKGMAYQALMIGPALALFAVFGTWIIPLVFGQEWLVSAKLFPVVAFSFLLLSIFDLHISILKIYDRLAGIAWHFFAYFILLYATACASMYFIGIYGYAVGQLFSTLSLLVLHAFTRKILDNLDYNAAFGIVVFVSIPLLASIVLPPVPSFVLYVVSIAMMFGLVKSSRNIVKEVFASAKPGKK